jgi:DNA-binding MarR family transcriptional regulator
MSTLSRELRVSLSAMTQIADRLERAHLVTRVSEENDRRVRCLQLTEQGETMMRERLEARVARVLTILEHVPSKARREICGALQTLHSACLTTRGENAAERIVDPVQPILPSSVSGASL